MNSRQKITFGCVWKWRGIGSFLFLMMAGALHGAKAPSLKDFFQPYLNRHVVAGAVALVANKDGVLGTEAFGYADVAQHRPMKTDTVFWIASQSKPITTTAFMMLVDEGKVSVDDPVEKYLPEFKGQMVIAEQDEAHVLLRKPSRLLAVRDILSHTSGFRFKTPVEQPTLDLLPLRDAVRTHALMPLQWEPGSKYQYSNAGINTVGRIIEVVSGMAYEDFLRTRLFEPLGMKETTFWPSEAQVRRMAKVYKPNKDKSGLEETLYDQMKYPLTDRTRYPFPAGGLFSTAADVARFARMILNGGQLDGRRYLSAAAVKQMTSKQTPAALKEGYGFGWSVGQGEFGHGGALGTETSIDPKSGLITIFMIQQAGFIGDGAKIRGEFKREARLRFGGAPSEAREAATLATTTGVGGTAGTGAAVVTREFIYEKAPYPSCHASTIVETTAGGIVAAWFGGTAEKNPDVGIWVSRFERGAWTTSVEVANGVQADGKRHPTWNPVLFQPRGNAPLMLFYKVGPSPQTWWGELRTSTDGGRTWSASRRLPDGIYGPIKNKPVQLADGTILNPTSDETDERPSKWRIYFERSADGGKTWTKTPFFNDGIAISAIQPSILFNDRIGGAKLQAVGRTRQGKVFTIASEDSGQTWGKIALVDGLPNPNSGTDAVTLKDGRHLLVYNPVTRGRTPLKLALSSDGRAWKDVVVLEDEPGEYSYPAVIQTSDGRVHITYTWKRERVRHVVIDPAKL